MPRKFNEGRQNEVLLNPQHYSIFKILEYYLNRPDNIKKGPVSLEDYSNIQNGALWLDKYSNTGSADLKYFDNGIWKLLFGDKFKLITDILSENEPENPVEGQLWINKYGLLMYYKNGQFVPIKSTLSDVEADNQYQYEDFLIIAPLARAEKAVLSNVSKFIFSNTPVEKWQSGKLYYYQQGVTDDESNLYVCCQRHYSTEMSDLHNTNLWIRVDTLIQYLIPNASYDKFFADEYFLHEKEMTKGSEVINTDICLLGASLTSSNSIVYENLRADFDNDRGYYDTLYAVPVGTHDDYKPEGNTGAETNEQGLIPAATMTYESSDILHYPLSFDTESDGFYFEGVYYSYDDYSMSLKIEDNNGSSGSDSIEIDLDTCYEEEDHSSDEDPYEEKGYIPNTTTSIYIPENDILRSLEDDHIPEFDFDYNENKLISAVHVNPARLNRIDKYLIYLNASNNVIEVPAENTEFYLMQNGYGKLLMENSEDGQIFDYSKTMVNGHCYIKLSSNIMKLVQRAYNSFTSSAGRIPMPYIYAVHYDFSTNVKTAGKLHRKKVFVNNPGCIYIGPQNMNDVCVFAHGLLYNKGKNTYEYDYATGYLQFKYRLLGSNDATADLSIIKFYNKFNGTITSTNYKEDNYIEGKGYRVELNGFISSQRNCIGFISGIQCDPDTEFKFYPTDNLAFYLPNVTKEYVTEHNGSIKWTLIDANDMYRGSSVATIRQNSDNEACIMITRDKNLANENLLYLGNTETPIVFVDGLLVDQGDITIHEDYLTIRNLQAGQKIILLGDKNSSLTDDDLVIKTETLTNLSGLTPEYALEDNSNGAKIIEDSNNEDSLSYVFEDTRYEHRIYDYSILINNYSDSVLYQETVSNVSIKTEEADSVLLYFEKGIKCDQAAVNMSEFPVHPINNQLCHIVNSSENSWYRYDKENDIWNKINRTFINSNNEESINHLYSELENTVGYSVYKKNVSILNGMQNQKYCTYFAYVYSDTVEEPLLTGYCVPDGITGTNVQLNEFQLGGRDFYIPGKNELSVYLNGVKQNLDCYSDTNFASSLSKECPINESDKFTLCIDNGTASGKAINLYEGYYVYKIFNEDGRDYIYRDSEMHEYEKNEYENNGFRVELISSPKKNVIFYVVEHCEGSETSACTKTLLTYKDSLASRGAFANNTYYNENMDLCKGHVKVFLNGLRLPFGSFKDKNGNDIICYSIINSHTIKINTNLIGGSTMNNGTIENPEFPINALNPDENYRVLDEILVETRNDLSLRELTIPISAGKTEFSESDGLPQDLFKTKDFIMIYINGLAYGNNFTNNGKIIKLNDPLTDNFMQSDNENNIITFEWR